MRRQTLCEGLTAVLLLLASQCCISSRTAGIEAKLEAIQKQLTGSVPPAREKLAGIHTQLRAICGSASALPKCEKWARDLGYKAQDDDDRNRRKAANEVLETIRQLRKQIGGPTTDDSAMLSFIYWRMQIDLENPPEAAEGVRAAEEALEKLWGPDDPKNAEPIAKLAEVYCLQGGWARAEPMFLRALDLLRKPGSDPLDTAYILDDLGQVYDAKGDYQNAETADTRALKIRQQLLKPDDPIIATSLSNLAELYDSRGEYRRAEPLLQQAVAILDKAAPDGNATASVRSNLGELYHTMGEYAKAEQQYRRALATLEREPEGFAVSVAVSNLASLYGDEGAFAQAEPLRLRSLNITKKLFGLDNANTAAVYNDLGAMYYLKGDYVEAEKAYRTALEIRRKVLLPDHSDLGTSLDNLARDLIVQGNYAEAEPLVVEGLKIREKALGPDHPDIATSAGNLGLLYFDRHNYAKAKPLLTRTLNIREKTLGRGHPDTVRARMEYARDLWQLSAHAEARDQLIAANRDIAGFWSSTLTTLEDSRRRSLAHKFDDLMSLSLSIAAQLSAEDRPGAVTLAALAIVARKGISSSASQEVFARIRRDRNPQALALLQKLTNIREQIGYWSRQTGPDAKDQLEKLQRTESETEKVLIDESGAYREWRTVVEPSQVSAAVPRESAFVDVVRYTEVDWASHKSQGNRYAAMVYVYEQEPQFVPLGPAEPIETAVRNLRSNFENMWRTCAPADNCRADARLILISGEQFQVNLSRTQADCVSLYALTMAKLRGRAGADKRLIVSPDAALAEIPWETMRDGDAGRYLVEEGYQIRYLDSARSLVYPTRPAAFKGPAVVIAEVDYDGKQASPVLAADAAGSDWPAGETPAGEQMGTWKPLNGGAEILRTIRELNQAGKIGPMRKLPLGSEEEVMALEQPAALIAHTHGFFRASTAGLESGSDGLDSGVALYGANHASEPSHKGKDGLLMAEEAMLLNLEGTRLVALLGCDTGRGVEAGEGVQGFRHALSVAGARSTLLTLWEVGDLSIARFLREFMIRSSPASRMTVDEALAETQLAFLRGEIQEPNALPGASRWRHPYFWAAATLGGEDGLLDLELRK